MVNLLFSYGTLNLHDIQSYLWGEEKQGRVKQLDDYRLNVYNSGIYYIDKEFGETVAGKVYELTDEQLERTDQYEGSAYTREKVTIDGDIVNVYVRRKSNVNEIDSTGN